MKEATQKRLTNGSPSATQCVLLGCASRGSWMHRNRRANDAGWRRGRWPLQNCNIWDARRCCSGALLRARLSQRRQRGLCCREPAGADGRLVGPPRAARGGACGLVGFDDGGRLLLPPQLLEVPQAQSRAILSLRRSHRAFRWKESSKRPGLSRASRPSTPKAARRSPPTFSRNLLSIILKSSAVDSPSPKRQKRELSRRRLRSWASHRKPGEAQLLGASLCRACWVGQLPLSVVLQLAHERERCLGADARSGHRHPVRSQTAQAATEFAARS